MRDRTHLMWAACRVCQKPSRRRGERSWIRRILWRYTFLSSCPRDRRRQALTYNFGGGLDCWIMNGLGITLSSKIGGVSDLALFPLLRRERRMIRNITYVETLRNKTAPTTPPCYGTGICFAPITRTCATGGSDGGCARSGGCWARTGRTWRSRGFGDIYRGEYQKLYIQIEGRKDLPPAACASATLNVPASW